MKEKIKQVFIEINAEWELREFRLLKEGDIFSFDKNEAFTASCDPYIVENEGCWSILIINKQMERFLEEKKKERDKLFGIL